MIDPGRSQFPGFYTKILAPSEAALHQPPLSFPVFLWTLWSIKESVYKFVRRHEPDLLFGPTKIVVEIFLPIPPPAVLPGAPAAPTGALVFQSRVRFRDALFHTRSYIFPDCISTVVSSTDDLTDVRWGLRRTNDASSVAESAAVRKYFLEEFCLLYPDSIWALDKSPAGYPILLRDNQPSEIPVSFAHHGGIVGYAYCM